MYICYQQIISQSAILNSGRSQWSKGSLVEGKSEWSFTEGRNAQQLFRRRHDHFYPGIKQLLIAELHKFL